MSGKRGTCLSAFPVAFSLLFPIAATAQRTPLFKTEILPVLEKNCVGATVRSRRWRSSTSAPSPG